VAVGIELNTDKSFYIQFPPEHSTTLNTLRNSRECRERLARSKPSSSASRTDPMGASGATEFPSTRRVMWRISSTCLSRLSARRLTRCLGWLGAASRCAWSFSSTASTPRYFICYVRSHRWRASRLHAASTRRSGSRLPPSLSRHRSCFRGVPQQQGARAAPLPAILWRCRAGCARAHPPGCIHWLLRLVPQAPRQGRPSLRRALRLYRKLGGRWKPAWQCVQGVAQWSQEQPSSLLAPQDPLSRGVPRC
jgi:hypothetical protein